jgi:hypothetical protein
MGKSGHFYFVTTIQHFSAAISCAGEYTARGRSVCAWIVPRGFRGHEWVATIARGSCARFVSPISDNFRGFPIFTKSSQHNLNKCVDGGSIPAAAAEWAR